ncbi:MAG: hypothetical protein KDB94_11380 [Acidobacteria bacterium]|nr:hypothetical protein [Acidobacteriota bacterium]
MALLGLVLIAIGLADLIAGGLGGICAGSSVRRRVAWLAATIVILVPALDSEGPRAAWLVFGLTEVVAIGLWLELRPMGSAIGEPRSDQRLEPRERRAIGVALTALIVALLLAFAVAHWPNLAPASAAERVEMGQLASWSDWNVGVQAILCLAGVLFVLGATGNAVVRSVLALAEVQLTRDIPALKGGRFIGLFERCLIVGLAQADLTAAALVVSAKSLLRFPEVSHYGAGNEAATSPAETARARPSLAELTEYFLLGSLVSWTVALILVPIARQAIEVLLPSRP